MVKAREKLCAFTTVWRNILFLIVILLVLSALSFLFVTPGSQSYYITLINFLVLGTLLIADLSLIYACKRHREGEPEDPKRLQSFEMDDENGSDEGE